VPVLGVIQKGKGGGDFQAVISRAAIIRSLNISTVKLTDAMRSKRSRPTSIWERLWTISPKGFHQRSASQA